MLAFLLSIGNIVYTWKKDKRARTQSIEDDYWLRKVLSPLAIEPLIEMIAELSSSLPEDSASVTEPTPDYRKFSQDCQSNLGKLYPSLKVLSMLHSEVCKNVILGVEKIEDELLEYCGANTQDTQQGSSSPRKTRTDTQERINGLLISILSEIKEFQAKSGGKK